MSPPRANPVPSVSGALAAIGRDLIAEARAAIAEDARRPDSEAVHDFRKAMKRWRALLRLIEPIVGPEARQLRDVARVTAGALAQARDPQAALDALADLAAKDGAPAAHSLKAIRARLEALKDAAETQTLTAATRARLADALADAEQALAHWPLDRIGMRDLAGELARTYRRTRGAIPDDWNTADAVALHELRKRVVSHRYQMELVEPLWPKLGKIWVGEAQKLRERLGAHHDLVVLAGLSAPHGPLARWRSRLAPAIAGRQAAHVKAARRIAGRLFAEKPKAFRARIEALWESRQTGH
jgi:CHAD domain-containing protein